MVSARIGVGPGRNKANLDDATYRWIWEGAYLSYQKRRFSETNMNQKNLKLIPKMGCTIHRA